MYAHEPEIHKHSHTVTLPKIIQRAHQALGRLAFPIVAVRGCFDISPYWHSKLPFLNAWDFGLQVSCWRQVPGAALWVLSGACEETENMQLPLEELPRLCLSLFQRWSFESPSLCESSPLDVPSELAVATAVDTEAVEAVDEVGLVLLVVVAELDKEKDVYEYPVAGMEK